MNFFNKELNQKWWQWPKPPWSAGSAKEWRIWKAHYKENYPIHKRIDDFFMYLRVSKRRYWTDAIYWFKYRFHPKHQYHILKPRSLKPGYHDPLVRILHAVMDEVATFYEDQIRRDIIDWEADITHSNAFDEMKRIHHWWTSMYPNRMHSFEIPNLTGKYSDFLSPFDDDFKDDDIIKRWRYIADIHNAETDAWNIEEDQMLKRAIDIRNFLWD